MTTEDPVLLIDCRWLGMGGAGRATELLLRGLTTLQPEGRYVLWGPLSVERYSWPNAKWQLASLPPTAIAGQAALLRIPAHDSVLYMHQIRPFLPGPSMTAIYDTIPIRHGGSRAQRAAKQAYLKAIGRLSTRIATLSHYSAACIETDLGVPAGKVSVLDYPVDEELRDRIITLRRTLPGEDVVLYVGRFAPHKNLHRLIEAFSATRAAAQGTRLVFVGGTESEIALLAPWALASSGSVELKGVCAQSELERLYATSRLLIMPSLEEGFGLPAWEALTSGLRVCLSDIPVFRELFPGVPLFDPLKVAAMATVMDEALLGPPPPVLGGTTPEAYAAGFISEVAAISS